MRGSLSRFHARRPISALQIRRATIPRAIFLFPLSLSLFRGTPTKVGSAWRACTLSPVSLTRAHCPLRPPNALPLFAVSNAALQSPAIPVSSVDGPIGRTIPWATEQRRPSTAPPRHPPSIASPTASAYVACLCAVREEYLEYELSLHRIPVAL